MVLDKKAKVGLVIRDLSKGTYFTESRGDTYYCGTLENAKVYPEDKLYKARRDALKFGGILQRYTLQDGVPSRLLQSDLLYHISPCGEKCMALGWVEHRLGEEATPDDVAMADLRDAFVSVYGFEPKGRSFKDILLRLRKQHAILSTAYAVS